MPTDCLKVKQSTYVDKENIENTWLNTLFKFIELFLAFVKVVSYTLENSSSSVISIDKFRLFPVLSPIKLLYTVETIYY